MPTDITIIPLPWTLVFANSTTALSHPASGWMTAAQFAKIRGTFEVRVRTGDIEVSLGYETAQVEDTPDNAVAFGTYKAGNGVQYPSGGWTDASANTDGKTLFRLVWLAKNTSTSNTNWARVGGSVQAVAK